MKNPIVKQIPCWNCNGTMVFCGHVGLYDFYRCGHCGVEKAEYEPQTEDSSCRATRPETPRAFTGSISGDRWGRHVKETNS